MNYIIYFFLAITTLVLSCSRSVDTEIQNVNVSMRHSTTYSTTKVILLVNSLIGSQYQYGAVGPRKFDCSGLIKYVYAQEGIMLSGGSRHIINQVRKISTKQSRVGDLVFFSNKGKLNHVGIISKIVEGSRYIIHSTTSKGVVEEAYLESPYWSKRVKSYGRVLNN